nr:MAG TPA: transposase [Inoviridae sp.]
MHYLGLDISKDTVDTYSDACGHLKIENTIQGIQTLLAHLQANGLNQGNTQICCEATNVYYLLAATTLNQHGYAVSVVNPFAIKGYAKMKLKRVKTDKQDAKLIAEFAAKEKPQCWQPNNETSKAIQSLHRRAEQSS